MMAVYLIKKNRTYTCVLPCSHVAFHITCDGEEVIITCATTVAGLAGGGDDLSHYSIWHII